MKLFVAVRANQKEERVEAIDQTHFRVRVKAPARDGQANEAVLKALARHFRVPPLHLSLLRGAVGKNKVIEFRR